MAYGAWYSDIVSAGKQAVTDIKTGAQTAAQQVVSQTAQTAQKAATSQIQAGTQAALQKIGVKSAAPAPEVLPSPVSIPTPLAPAQVVKKAGLPIALFAVAGVAFWFLFLRKK